MLFLTHQLQATQAVCGVYFEDGTVEGLILDTDTFHWLDLLTHDEVGYADVARNKRINGAQVYFSGNTQEITKWADKRSR